MWALRTLFEAPIGADLTLKGGISLSKIYKVIDRFSEDIDLTYDIRKLIPDLIGEDVKARIKQMADAAVTKTGIPGVEIQGQSIRVAFMYKGVVIGIHWHDAQTTFIGQFRQR